MKAVGPDVWVLTEAVVGSVPPVHAGVALSAAMPGVDSGACFAIVSAAALHVIALPEVPTAAAALVHTSAGDQLVVGVCMPWRNNAPALPPSAAPGQDTGPEQWHHVLGQLDKAMGRLRASWPYRPLVIAGDFNETLSGLVVGSTEGRKRLDEFLRKHGLTALTADAPSAKEGCLSVDHIFGPSVEAEVATFPTIAEVAGPKGISNHLGYSVDLA